MVRATKFDRERGITLRFINAREIVCNVIHLAQLESLQLEYGPELNHAEGSKWNNCAPCSATSR
jgi:hypothetical protein